MYNNFDFLENIFEEGFNLAINMEKNIFSNYEAAGSYATKFLEKLVDKIYFEAEGKEFEKHIKLANKIEKLSIFEIIPYNIKTDLHNLRKIRNDGVHNKYDIDNILMLDKGLFYISIWFYEKFGNDSNFEKPKYVIPYELDDEDSGFDGAQENIESIISNTISREFDKYFNSQSVVGDINDDIKPYLDDFPEYGFHKLNGSYLLGELSKLNIHSKEAVADSVDSSDFKKYMHIETDIQNDFISVLKEANSKDSAQLVLLSGSVGDGKSHLFSYLENSEYSELINSFEVIGDATESRDPQLSAIDNLHNILIDFNDENINNPNKKRKMVVGINLGILNAFMDDNQVKKDFTKLLTLLNGMNIFNSENITLNNNGFVSMVNFADYQLFELYEDKVESRYISAILNRITLKDKSNPFYVAYKTDIQNGYWSPIIFNFELLMNDDVKYTVIQILIKYILINKKFLSTRELLNFIYDIIVYQEDVGEYDQEKLSDYVEMLLPCLIYKTVNKSELLAILSKNTPFDIRNEFIDNYLISLNTLDLDYVFDKYFDKSDELDKFVHFISTDYYENLTKKEKEDFASNLIYFAPFFGNSNFKENVVNSVYSEFIEDLYYYNFNQGSLHNLFRKLRKAILAWKGFSKSNWVIIDSLKDFTISKELEIDFIRKSFHFEGNKFKSTIIFNCVVVGDECNVECNGNCIQDIRKCIPLEIDYFLYESIFKLNHGYRPNKKEKDSLYNFENFIGNLVDKINNRKLLIIFNDESKTFWFKKSSNGYSFEEDY